MIDYMENNKIDPSVIIHENVIIGKNNIIKSGTVIYPNTVIGDNNVILEDNYLGTLAVEAKHRPNELKYKGLIIGDNNIFHIKNIVSSGFYGKTIIGNNNKILSGVYISHDNIIHNNVTFYPRVFSAGIVEYFDHSNVGAGAFIHQKTKIGSYSMIGMNTTVVKNVLPYFVNINGRYTRLNYSKISDEDLVKLKLIELDVIRKKSYMDKIRKFPKLLKKFEEVST